MPFCPSCHDEFRPGFDHCPDCDVDLVAELAPPPPVPDPVPWVPVHTGYALPEAEITRSILSSEGIETRLENEHAWNTAIGIPSALIPLIVSVPAPDEPAAREILEQVERKRREARAEGGSDPPAPTAKRAFPWQWVLGGTLAILALDAHGGFRGTGSGPGVLGSAWFVALLGLVYYLRQRGPVGDIPVSMPLTCFLYGLLPASLSTMFIEQAVDPTFGDSGRSAAYHFFVVGPVEEAIKILGPLVLLGVVKRWRSHPYAWLLAAASSGAGFGCGENVLHSMGGGGSPVYQFLMRSVAFYHVFLTGTIGYIIGDQNSRSEAVIMAAVMYPLAIIAHAIWNVTCVARLEFLLPAYLALALLALRGEVRALARKGSPAGAAVGPEPTISN